MPEGGTGDQWPIPEPVRFGQNGVMAFAPSALIDIARAGRRVIDDLAALPAQHLASFMDDVDEVWVSDALMDQPGRIDPTS